jgi:BirA family biotin operon repressor/biotin-[acetyl-CoA-carboxylase] ligase
LLPLAAAVAVAEAVGPGAMIKWPNDVLVDGRKVAGILAEGRPHEGWVVLGIGVNVALRADDLPPELRETAGTLGRDQRAVEPFLGDLLTALDRALALDADALLTAWRGRDALAGQPVAWAPRPGEDEVAGVARGVDADGRLLVDLDGGGRVALSAGEVHLARRP